MIAYKDLCLAISSRITWIILYYYIQININLKQHGEKIRLNNTINRTLIVKLAVQCHDSKSKYLADPRFLLLEHLEH